MATAWVVTAAAPTLELGPDGRGSTTVTVTNPGPVAERAVLEVVPGDGADPRWFTVAEAQRTVGAGESVAYQVAVTVPPGTPAGSHSLQPRVYSADTPPEESAALGPRIGFAVAALAAPPKPKRWWWVPIAVAVLMVVLVVAWLLLKDDDAADPEEPPPPAGPVIETFEVVGLPDCATFSVGLAWETTGATSVTVSIDGPGIFDTFGPDELVSVPFACDGNQHEYLLTAVDDAGATVTSLIVVDPP